VDCFVVDEREGNSGEATCACGGSDAVSVEICAGFDCGFGVATYACAGFDFDFGAKGCVVHLSRATLVVGVCCKML
jgi:hypothetical protein